MISISLGCATADKMDPLDAQIKEYFAPDPDSREVFRVLLLSDRYLITQMKFPEKIKRTEDPGGDKYMCEELKKFDKINEVREGILAVWVYPDSGRLMKVRPKKLTYLMEIDQLLVEDIQRWSFQFPRNDIDPTQFDVRYRVMLRKQQSDEEIMKEVREKIKEKQGSH
jgi:hypothetical protein